MNNLDKTPQIYEKISHLIEESKKKIVSSVNNLIVKAYWEIGKEILEEEQKGELRAEYGKALIENLAEKLTRQYGKGFSARNLWQMRKFYETYPIVNALRAELSWTHYRLILKIENKQIFASRYKLYLPTEEELRTELLREKELIETSSALEEEEQA